MAPTPPLLVATYSTVPRPERPERDQTKVVLHLGDELIGERTYYGITAAMGYARTEAMRLKAELIEEWP